MEVVVDGRVNGDEFLKASHPPETEHGVSSSAGTAGLNSPPPNLFA